MSKTVARSKKELKANIKNVSDLLYSDPDPPLKLYRKFDWHSINHSYSSTAKKWHFDSRRCSQIQQYPQLLLHYEMNITEYVMNQEWNTYWWARHRNPLECPKCIRHPKYNSTVKNCEQGDLNLMTEGNLKDPYSLHPFGNIQFTNSIMFNKRFYLLSLQGALATIDVYQHPRLTILDVQRAVPSTVSKGFKEYLVEVSGELWVVFLVFKKSMNIVDDVEVFQLDLPRLKWIKMESLGEHALFVSNYRCTHVFPTKLEHCRKIVNLTCGDAEDWCCQHGCRNNSVYFTHGGANDWWVFHMEDGSISLHGKY